MAQHRKNLIILFATSTMQFYIFVKVSFFFSAISLVFLVCWLRCLTPQLTHTHTHDASIAQAQQKKISCMKLRSYSRIQELMYIRKMKFYFLLHRWIFSCVCQSEWDWFHRRQMSQEAKCIPVNDFFAWIVICYVEWQPRETGLNGWLLLTYNETKEEIF